MSWASLLAAAAWAALLVACSGEQDAGVTATNTPGKGVTFVAPAVPTATPLPDSILNDGCPVSEPNGAVPPGERPERASNVLGNGAVYVGLWDEGTVVFEPGGPGGVEADGALSMKFFWWRSVTGRLEITGRRLDGAAPALRASIPEGYGNTGFQASALIFPAAGCWEVTGHVGESSLTFVTRVVSFY